MCAHRTFYMYILLSKLKSRRTLLQLLELDLVTAKQRASRGKLLQCTDNAITTKWISTIKWKRFHTQRTAGIHVRQPHSVHRSPRTLLSGLWLTTHELAKPHTHSCESEIHAHVYLCMCMCMCMRRRNGERVNICKVASCKPPCPRDGL